MTNESAILGLLADLYQQRAALQAENAQLRHELDTATQAAAEALAAIERATAH